MKLANQETIFATSDGFKKFKLETCSTGNVDREYMTFNFVVVIAMENLRVEVNQVNDIKTYLEQDP